MSRTARDALMNASNEDLEEVWLREGNSTTPESVQLETGTKVRTIVAM